MSHLPDNYKVVGKDWSAPILQPKFEWAYDINGDRITVYYRDVTRLWKSRLPALLSELGELFGIVVTTKMVSAVARQVVDCGALVEVEILYVQQNIGIGESVPETLIVEDGSSIKESITHHPNFKAASGTGTPSDANSPWNQYWDAATGRFQDGSADVDSATPDYLLEVTDYDIGSSTVTVTDYFADEPPNIKSLLGKYAAPPEASPEAATKYLILTGSKGKSGRWWVRRLVYQYADGGFPTEIYSAASGADTGAPVTYDIPLP